jgi:transposase-like protein
MERDWLAAQLEAGRSMESIAREVGKNPSTVAYWVEKHGLVSPHAASHRGKGPIAAEVLAEMVLRGLSIRQMAAELGRSYTSVRHWLARHEIRTPRAVTLADTAEARGSELAETQATCPTHGMTRYIRESEGFRCAACRSERVTRHRRSLKAILVAEAGGACVLCGYSRCLAALEFHHVEPSTKSFAISRNGVTISLDALRAEARKCALLCANCHAEVGAGAARLTFPAEPAPDSPG